MQKAAPEGAAFYASKAEASALAVPPMMGAVMTVMMMARLHPDAVTTQPMARANASTHPAGLFGER